jgi:antitoxin component HigA of HigAB toxin-antitoxin module
MLTYPFDTRSANSSEGLGAGHRSLNGVYEILSHNRPLTLNMIRRLHESFGISAERLIRAPKLTAAV